MQSNPFSKQESKSANAGMVAIEQERATAEAQGRMIIAKKFPRDEMAAFEKVMNSCKRHGLAATAMYSYPRGGKKVTGASIRLAEEIARCWGNIDFGIMELSQKEGYSEMMAYAWDMETNVVSKQQFTVKHLRDKRGGAQQLTDQRDIYEIAANMGARRLRARIMAILPPDLIESAVNQCALTLRGGNGKPIMDRVKAMISAFAEISVSGDQLKRIVKKSLDSIDGEDIVNLTGIYRSIKDGMSKPSDWIEGDLAPENKDTTASKMLKSPAKATKKEPEKEPEETLETATEKQDPNDDFLHAYSESDGPNENIPDSENGVF